MNNKSRLARAFLEAAGTALAGGSVMGGALVGTFMALPKAPLFIPVVLAAVSAVATYLAGISAAEAWRMKYPENPAENAKYVRNLVTGLVLGATIMAGGGGYHMMEGIVGVIKEGHPPATASAPVPVPAFASSP